MGYITLFAVQIKIYLMKKILLPLCITLLVYSCKNDTKINDSLVFNIDSTKISSIRFIDGFDVSFHPPINWEEVEADISERIVNSLKSQRAGNSKYIYKPSRIFLNKSTNSLLAVGKVETPDPEPGTNIKINDYIGIVTENFDQSISKRGSFIKDGITITQLLIQKQNLISFKLIFEIENTLYQFDYTAQKEYYKEELKSIESSMGTIKLITK